MFKSITRFLKCRRSRTFRKHKAGAATRDHFSEPHSSETDAVNADDGLPLDFVQLEIRDSIDLHTFAPRDIPVIAAEYLREAHAAGFGTVRIIHGKGYGTQRAVVRHILAQTDFVVDYADAPPYAGGWGATIAHLAPVNDKDANA